MGFTGLDFPPTTSSSSIPTPFFPDFAFFKRAAIIFLAINALKSPVYVFCY